MTRDVVVKLLRTMKEFGESEITHTFMGNEPNEISISFDRAAFPAEDRLPVCNLLFRHRGPHFHDPGIDVIFIRTSGHHVKMMPFFIRRRILWNHSAT